MFFTLWFSPSTCLIFVTRCCLLGTRTWTCQHTKFDLRLGCNYTFGKEDPNSCDMPLSNRRRARRKEIQLQETSDAEAPDSSPSRPSAKKRKVSQNKVSSPRRNPAPRKTGTKTRWFPLIQVERRTSPPRNVKHESGDEAEDSTGDHEPATNQDLVDLVISYLNTPREELRSTRPLQHQNREHTAHPGLREDRRPQLDLLRQNFACQYRPRAGPRAESPRAVQSRRHCRSCITGCPCRLGPEQVRVPSTR